MPRPSKTTAECIFHDLDCQLSCVCSNKDGSLVATAGRNLLQLFSVEANKFTPLSRTKSNASGPSILITDLSWCPSDESLFASSNTNGSVQLWNCNRISSTFSDVSTFTPHTRTCHRVNFHPLSPFYILTASQDHTVKLIDTRSPSSHPTELEPRNMSYPVRDAQFRPDGTLIAAAQDNGQVVVWDARMNQQPYLVMTCYSSAALALDWHPRWSTQSHNWFATAGGRDHAIKVWDMNYCLPASSGGQSTAAPSFVIRTSNVTRIRWRVGKDTQLISCSNSMNDKSILLWDLERIYVPLLTFEKHKDNVSALYWPPEDNPYSFFSSGKDGLLVRHSVKQASKPIENPMAVAVGPMGDIVFASAVGKLKNASKRFNASGMGLGGGVNPALAMGPGKMMGPTRLNSIQGSAAQGKIHGSKGLPPMAPISNPSRRAKFAALSTPFMYSIRADFEEMMKVNWQLYLNLFPDSLIVMADNYRLIGKSIEEVCNHNANVADRSGKPWLVDLWHVLALLFASTKTTAIDLNQSLTKQATLSNAVKDLLSNAGTSSSPLGTGTSVAVAASVSIAATNHMAVSSPVTVMAGTPHQTATTPTAGAVPSVPSAMMERRSASIQHNKLNEGERSRQSSIHKLELAAEVAGAIGTNTEVGNKVLLPDTSNLSEVNARSGGNRLRFNMLPEEDTSWMASYLAAGGAQMEHLDQEMSNPGIFKEIDFYRCDLHNIPFSNMSMTEKGDWLTPILSEMNDTFLDLTEESILHEHSLDTRAMNKLLLKVPTANSDIMPISTNENHDQSTTVSSSLPVRRMSLSKLANCGYEDNMNGMANFLNNTHSETSTATSAPPMTKTLKSSLRSEFTSVTNGSTGSFTQKSVRLAFNSFEKETASVSSSGIFSQSSVGSAQFTPPPGTPLDPEEDVHILDDALLATTCHQKPLTLLQALSTGELHAWLPNVSELLCEHLENMVDHQDELPTAVTVMLVLGDKLDWKHHIEPNRVKSWFLDYLDLLHRYGLNVAATKVINCVFMLSNNPSSSFVELSDCVASLNHEGTVVRTRCGRCSKPLEPNACSCKKHTQPSRIVCVLCHRTVHGLFLWCQGCSHGGHMKHVQEWMERHQQCPAGCGHRCEYT